MNKLTLLLVMLVFTGRAYAVDDAWARSYNLEASGQYLVAAESLSPLLKREPKNEMVHLRSGWLYYLAGNYSTAIQHYQTALQLNHESIDARLGMTLPLLAQARWREAAQQAQAVIKESRWHYYANLRLLVCEEGLKQWDTLKQHALALTRHYPSDAGFLVYLARAYDHLGDKTKAREAYTRVLERYPGHLEASQYLAK